MRWLSLVAVVSAACGDDLLPPGPALATTANLTIVAHQDDDLLFMQPDLADIADRRAGLTNVYVTAGNAREGLAFSDRRNAGLMEAYAEASGVESDWTCGWIELAGRAAEHCLLVGAPISLVFLGYPDGGKQGESPDSLLRLFSGSITSATTIARRPARYDQAGLIATLAEIIHISSPTTIRTLEIAATHGRDHTDHMLVGALTLLATAEAGTSAELLAFRGYATELEPENVIDPLYNRSANNLAHYHACASECGSCGTACPTLSPTHASWLRRRYAVALRTNLAGVLRLGDRCLQAHPATGAAILGDCATAAPISLASGGVLQTENACFAVQPDGGLVKSATCPEAAEQRFLLDDEGHLWNGAPAPPSEVSAGTHLRCLSATGDRVVLAPCGESHAPSWELSQPAVTLERPTWLPREGRTVGVYHNFLYTVIAGQLVEAHITETGFAAPTTVGAFPIEPESLVVANLEQGRIRACGRDADGILCGSIFGGYLPVPFTLERWTPAFARSGPVTPGDRSIAAFRADICGLSDDGVICAPRGPAFVPDVRSRWPRPDTTLWVGDIDGDREADWCAATPTGVACGRAVDRPLTEEGVPWSFALAGSSEPAPVAAAIGILHDIDADRRDDLCTVVDRKILCARSQGYGFGPRVSIGTLPPGGPATDLWISLERACVDDGTSVACVVLPRPPAPI